MFNVVIRAKKCSKIVIIRAKKCTFVAVIRAKKCNHEKEHTQRTHKMERKP